jgi:Protein of unknown function (DUF3108)
MPARGFGTAIPATATAASFATATLLAATALPAVANAQSKAAAPIADSRTVAAPAGAQTIAEPTIAAFAAHYTADWKTINVGTSDLELKPDGVPGHYIYTWTVTARGVFRVVYSNDVIQKSWFSVLEGHVRPARYHAEDGSSTVDIDFDWQNGRARGTSEKKPIDLKLDEGTQDVMSIQIEVLLDLKSGNLPTLFHIVDKTAIKDFIYAVEGPARLRTALGELDTIVVSSQRSASNRVLRMWFAPSLGFIPVQAERSRDGKLEFAMRIKTLKR